MDFKLQNDKVREFYKKDFSEINKIIKAVRKALVEDKEVDISDINTEEFFNENNLPDIIYITLFQAKQKPLRFGSIRNTLKATLQRIVDIIKTNNRFENFDIQNENICRIMFEYLTDLHPVKYTDVHMNNFDENRFHAVGGQGNP